MENQQNEWPKKIAEQKPQYGQRIIITDEHGQKIKDDNVDYWLVDRSGRAAISEHECGGVLLMPHTYWKPYIEPKSPAW